MNFERGQDPKYTIGIGNKALIFKWFEEWAPDAEYVINPDLSIDVEGLLDVSYTQITSLPNNLRIYGSLWIESTKITSLPDNLSVEQNLDIRDTKITSLPDSLKVKGTIWKHF